MDVIKSDTPAERKKVSVFDVPLGTVFRTHPLYTGSDFGKQDIFIRVYDDKCHRSNYYAKLVQLSGSPRTTLPGERPSMGHGAYAGATYYSTRESLTPESAFADIEVLENARIVI